MAPHTFCFEDTYGSSLPREPHLFANSQLRGQSFHFR